MAVYSLNHDYVFVTVPGNGAQPALNLLIDLERRFHDATGNAPRPAGTAETFFDANASPSRLRTTRPPCLLLLSDPLLRAMRGYQYLRQTDSPFTRSASGTALEFRDFVRRLAETDDAARPDGVRSQAQYFQPWRHLLTDICFLEHAERGMKKFIFKVFGVKNDALQILRGFSMVSFEGCTTQLTPTVLNLIHTTYRDDYAFLQSL